MKMMRVGLLAVLSLVLALVPVPGRGATPDLDTFVYLPLVSRSTPPVLNVVVNGDFEAGRTGWIEFEDSAFFVFPLIVQAKDLRSPVGPYDGEWAAWLGGDSGLLTYIEQQITIPASAPELEYWYWIDSVFACDASYGGVAIDSTLVVYEWLCAGTDTGGWVRRTVDLSAYAGQTVTFRMVSQTDVSNYSSLYVDGISIHGSP